MKTAARKSLKRAGLSAAAVAALLTASGCSAINPVATAEVGYAPADGIVVEMGDLKATDLLIVAESAEAEGRLLGSLTNSGDQDMTVTVDADGATGEIPVPAGTTLKLAETEPVLLDPAGAMPGLMVQTEISAAGESVTESVPVLDHTFPRYAEYIPGGAPTTPANPSNVPAKPGDEAFVGGQQADEH
ncbi:hypothetical protein GMA12_13095 [Kocuria sediminis]|uniref:DNA modification methylase n=1 Tax=Kocuria sediminis TaxID=1038857 RepID=A0A6N8GPG2_9MICC|nr:hypothetical protein [Kocuria sediminis]